MNDKYEMAVTINPLVSPLLYDRLSRCATARERAMVIRSLAEAALRGESTQHPRSPHLQSVAPVPARTAMSALPATEEVAGEGFQILSVGDTANLAPKFSVDLLRQLAGYLD